MYSNNAKINLKNKNYINYIINSENFRSKSPGKDISHLKSSKFITRKYKDDNNLLNIKEINISLYRKFSAWLFANMASISNVYALIYLKIKILITTSI